MGMPILRRLFRISLPLSGTSLVSVTGGLTLYFEWILICIYSIAARELTVVPKIAPAAQISTLFPIR